MTVAGAGALGLCVAVRLARAGAKVTVRDPAVLGDNASGVAAGMLAPAFESVLDPAGGDHFRLLSAAHAAWPGFLAELGGAEALFDRSGAAMAAFEGEEGALAAAAERLAALEVPVEPLSGAALRALHPGLSREAVAGFLVREERRVAPGALLAALKAALARLGGRMESTPVSAAGKWEGTLVVAAGADAATLAALAPELSRLVPVKGQILHFDAPPVSGPTVRSLAGYVAPQGRGAIAGATMEPGRRDRRLEPATLAALRANAARLFPALADAPAEGRAGVRAATPDGAPLVGRSAGRDDVMLCVGARRNGWLLAPFAAQALVDILAGEDPGPFAATLDPRRFG